MELAVLVVRRPLCHLSLAIVHGGSQRQMGTLL
jgi:hypothetical protein